MTFETAFARRDFCTRFLPMARMAIQSTMRTSERELCLPVVVEPPSMPTIRIVTLGAIGPKAPLVMLISMTTHARSRRVFV